MLISYSEPTQTHKGMWKTILTNEEGRTILIVEKTTKKNLLQWIKEDKNKGEMKCQK